MNNIKNYSIFITVLLLLNACNSERSAGIACGGAMNATCPINSFCQLEEQCGGIDKNGVCKWIPENCGSEVQTICGCDGKEYINECTANILSISKRNDGPCIKPPTIEVSPE